MATDIQEIAIIITDLKCAAVTLQDPKLMRSIQRLEQIIAFRIRDPRL